VLATYNGYTEEEDLSAASLIVNCLGDDENKIAFKGKSVPLSTPGMLSFKDIMNL
jgi:hypothetical protein